MRLVSALMLLFMNCVLATQAYAQSPVRLKDLVDVEGVRSNDLIGYGLVVGLSGTGDTLRNAPYTEEALISLLERLGVNVQDDQIRPENVAAVVVTARLPAFARQGSAIDVNVSSVGDAQSLSGGFLVMTPLVGADNNVYAVAQGPVVVSGFEARGQGAAVQQGPQTVGSIPGGARVEREVAFTFGDMSLIRLALKDPDFTTAKRISDHLNAKFGEVISTALDAGTVEINVSISGETPAYLIASIEGELLVPDRRARVVIDQRSGTVVLGENVRIAPVAVAQGPLTISVTETPVASQPQPFGQGQTAVLPRSQIQIDQGTAEISALQGGATLKDLVDGLNALDVPPRDMVDIFEALKAAGALHADIILQ